jgi:Protein of unknown function (DUF2510)
VTIHSALKIGLVHELRWWDGSRWTENVSDGGRTGVDAL